MELWSSLLLRSFSCQWLWPSESHTGINECWWSVLSKIYYKYSVLSLHFDFRDKLRSPDPKSHEEEKVQCPFGGGWRHAVYVEQKKAFKWAGESVHSSAPASPIVVWQLVTMETESWACPPHTQTHCPRKTMFYSNRSGSKPLNDLWHTKQPQE